MGPLKWDARFLLESIKLAKSCIKTYPTIWRDLLKNQFQIFSVELKLPAAPSGAGGDSQPVQCIVCITKQMFINIIRFISSHAKIPPPHPHHCASSYKYCQHTKFGCKKSSCSENTSDRYTFFERITKKIYKCKRQTFLKAIKQWNTTTRLYW